MEARSALRTSWSAEESQASVWPICFPAAGKGPGRPAWSSGHRGLAENKRQTGRRPDTGQASRLVPAPGKALRALDSVERLQDRLLSSRLSDRKRSLLLLFLFTKESTLRLSWQNAEGSFGGPLGQAAYVGWEG